MFFEKLLDPQKTVYLTPQDFLRAAVEYFEWAESHPLKEEVTGFYQGEVCRGDVSKVRPFTKRGLAIYLGMPVSRLESYRARGEDWEEAVEMVEQVIYTQKFENAAAGLLNSTIVSRDLGLAERNELTGRDGEPLQTVVQYQLPSNGRDIAPTEADHDQQPTDEADGS